MHIETKNICIRAFAHKDAEHLYAIAREREIYRFMPDWADGFDTPQAYHGLIDWFQQQQDNTDITIGRRYAIALPETDQLIGMVGVGLEETLNEVEMAYFMSAAHRRKGYTQQAVEALAAWCFEVSALPYLILTIDCANEPSSRLAEKCGFALFEKRTPIGHRQPNMEGDSYFYYRRGNPNAGRKN